MVWWLKEKWMYSDEYGEGQEYDRSSSNLSEEYVNLKVAYHNFKTESNYYLPFPQIKQLRLGNRE